MGMFDFNPDRAHGKSPIILDSTTAKVISEFSGHFPASLAHRSRNLSAAGVAFCRRNWRERRPRVRDRRTFSRAIVHDGQPPNHFPSRSHSQNPSTSVASRV